MPLNRRDLLELGFPGQGKAGWLIPALVGAPLRPAPAVTRSWFAWAAFFPDTPEVRLLGRAGGEG